MATFGGWWPVVREPFSGAWQQTRELRVDSVLSNVTTVYRCVALISSDIAKLRVRLVEKKGDEVWFETSVPAFSPVLIKPCVLPRRWVVERTFSWFGRNRRLAKDFENLAETMATLREPRFDPARPQADCQGVGRELHKPPVGNGR